MKAIDRVGLKQAALSVLAIVALISLKWLFDDNMGMGTINEANLLPFSRQHVETNWLPTDWYYNLPPGYRVPFIAIFGRMGAAWGFLLTSIVGRFIGYTAIASGLLFLSRRLNLRLLSLLIAIVLFLYINPAWENDVGQQGIVAGEWLIGGIEPKVIAYPLILGAIGLMLSGRYIGMMALLGLATSFHTLVGGWAFLSVAGWLMIFRHTDLRWRSIAFMLGVYVVTSAFAILPVIQQITVQDPASLFSPSFTYVYLRTPHHLNPLVWRSGWWIKAIILLVLLIGSKWLLRQEKEQGEVDQARSGLFTFTLVSLIPFGLGLIAAPFDQEGKFLQYYPFRFGDLMLPLNTCLLIACVLQQRLGRSPKSFKRGCLTFLALICLIQAPAFVKDAASLQRFPHEQQDIDSAGTAVCRWIQQNTPQAATIVTPPVDLTPFSWISERATIAKFKLVPPTAAGIGEWLNRLTDLSGAIDPWQNITRTQDNRDIIRDRLTEGYNQLTTEQAAALMQKYRSNYIVTRADHQLNLPIAYRNDRYRVYQRT